MYFVYILINESGERYVGMTEDLKRILKEHARNEVTSTSGQDYVHAWHGAFRNKETARDFEKYLKSSSGHAFTNKRLLS
jgi:predicted GIY-YIG superfamily endonuclease